MMSVSFLNFVPLHWAHLLPTASPSASGVYHESAPARAKSSITLRFTLGSFRGWLQPSHRNTAMGTPQTRWREMHQSGRGAGMLGMRSSPPAGAPFTFFMFSSVRLRSEERRGGEEGRYRWWPYHLKKKKKKIVQSHLLIKTRRVRSRGRDASS